MGKTSKKVKKIVIFFFKNSSGCSRVRIQVVHKYGKKVTEKCMKGELERKWIWPRMHGRNTRGRGKRGCHVEREVESSIYYCLWLRWFRLLSVISRLA